MSAALLLLIGVGAVVGVLIALMVLAIGVRMRRS